MSTSLRPLCVDLDGTLTPVDTLHEGLLTLTGRSFSQLWRLPGWLLNGRAAFKARVAEHAPVDATHLPWRTDLIEWLRAERAQGRRLVLATAANQSTAEAVARHLRLFDEIIASDDERNLAGPAKRAALVERFGVQGFDYVGNSRADLHVWRDASHAVTVATPASVRRQLHTPLLREFAPRPAGMGAWLRAMRPHQWAKNVLVFLPLLLAHALEDPATLVAALSAFVAFCLCASSVYVLNDLLDLGADRRHPRKRNRPFAAGRIGAAHGATLAAALLSGAVAVAATAGPGLIGVLVGYYVLTMAYSLFLKRLAIIDVLLLAGLYTIRIIAGSAATGIVPSFWLLAFSAFLFLSLGTVKRYAELNDRRRDGGQAFGRGYAIDDLPLLGNLGTSAGLGAVIILALYVQSPQSQALYSKPWLLWLLCPLLLYWICHIWFVTHRGRMHDDPLVFALRDRASQIVAALAGAAIVVAA